MSHRINEIIWERIWEIVYEFEFTEEDKTALSFYSSTADIEGAQDFVNCILSDMKIERCGV